MLTPLSWRQNNLKIEKADSTINLIQEPQLFTPSENRMNFRFEAVQQFARQTATIRLAIIDIVPNQEDLIISNDLYTIRLKASVIAGFNQFITFNTSTPQNIEAIAEDLGNVLFKDNLIGQDYRVYLEGTVVVISAYSSSRDYDLTVTLPSSGIVIQSQNGASPEYVYNDLIDYNLFAHVYTTDGFYGETIDRTNAIYSNTLYTAFYTNILDYSVEDLVKKYVDVVLPKKELGNRPQADLLDLKSDIKVSRPYFIVYGDSYRALEGGNRRERIQGQSSILYTINAALDKLNYYDLTPYIVDTNSSNATKFLTSSSDKLIKRESHEYLAAYFKSNNNGNELYMNVDIRFNDDTRTTKQYLITNDANSLKGVVSFDVSPQALDLIAIETIQGVDIDYYDVYLSWRPRGTNTSRNSSKKRYTLTKRCQEVTENIIFINEYGVWDSLITEGYEQFSISRTQNTFETALPSDANEITAISKEVLKVHRIDSETLYTLSSGYVPKEQFRWLERLSDASTAYIWSKSEQAYKHIILNDVNYTYNDMMELGNLTITFRYTTTNNTITR